MIACAGRDRRGGGGLFLPGIAWIGREGGWLAFLAGGGGRIDAGGFLVLTGVGLGVLVGAGVVGAGVLVGAGVVGAGVSVGAGVVGAGVLVGAGVVGAGVLVGAGVVGAGVGVCIMEAQGLCLRQDTRKG